MLERARVLPAHALRLPIKESFLTEKASRGNAAAGLLACMCAAQTVCPRDQRFFLLPKMPLRGSLTASFIDSA